MNSRKLTITSIALLSCALALIPGQAESRSKPRLKGGQVSSVASSGPTDWTGLKARLESIVKKSGLKAEQLGLIVSAPGGTTVYALNETKGFVPASLSKIVTGAGVIDALLPTYQFHTQVFVDGTQTGTDLKGNVYLKGGGDPAFVSEKMWFLVNEFYRENIRHIDGKIVVDDTLFDDQAFDSSREDVRVERAYDAPVGAMSFNWNSVSFFIRPGSKAGEPAKVWVDPPNEYIKLKSKVMTTSGVTSLDSNREVKDGFEEVTVTGKIAVGGKEQHIYKNITSPALFSGYHFKEFLKQRGITVSGGVQKGVVPQGARLAADCPSEPLSKILVDMAKFSNNYVAEMLTKDLAAIKLGTPAKLSDGVAQLKEFLKKVGVPADQAVFSNPSGLTRNNVLSPLQFLTVLRYVQNQFALFPEFVQALPIAGVDGTLEHRFHGTGAERWVRAKTGLLEGVTGLAGYAGRGNGDVLTFAFLYNGGADGARVRAVFDELAASLTQ